MARLMLLLLLGLALFGSAQDDEDYGGYGGDEDDYGDMGGGEPPPPAEGVIELKSIEEFEAFIAHDDASVVGAFTAKEMPDPAAVKPDGWDDEEDGEWSAEVITTPALAAFNEAATSLYNFRFAATVEPEVLAKLKTTKGGVYLYRSPQYVSKEHGDRPRERFPSESFTDATLATWLKSKAQPLVGPYSEATKERYEKAKAVAVIFFNLDFDKNAKGVAYVLKRARKAAAELKAKGVAVAVASSTDMSFEMEDFGLEVKSKASDILMGIKAGEKYYGGTAAFSGPALTAFVESYLKGELTAYDRPPPPPYEPPPLDEDSEGYDEDSEGYDEEKDEM